MPRAHHFLPWEVRKKIFAWFEHLHPSANPNRGRLSGTAQSLTFGHRQEEDQIVGCVIKRTTDQKFDRLISLVHELAQNAVGPMLPYLGFQILKLGVGQNLNQHRDYHNHPEYQVHQVTPVTQGEWYPITLYTPGKFDRLTAQDWDILAQAGFPIYLYKPLPARMRRLTTPSCREYHSGI